MAGFIARRDYNPGDLIHREDPFAKVVRKKAKDLVCHFCFQRSTTLKSCKRCLFVKYCKKSCQEADWPDHRLECKHLKNLPENIHQDLVRLLGRVILKIKGKDWKSITLEVLGTTRSFDDIDTCHAKMTEDRKEMLKFQEVKDHLRSYIGDENMPKEDDLIKIVGKVQYHLCRHLWNAVPVGYRFFLVGDHSFDKECIPNSNWQVTSKQTLKIWANKKINKGKDKISVSVGNLLFSPPGQSDECKCTDCSLPAEASILNKIIDKTRAHSVITSTENFLESISLTHTTFGLPFLDDAIVTVMLKEHEGVLADTHILHLKLLGVYLRTGAYMSDLMKLERCMRSVFGEYYIEMKPIYQSLMEVNLQQRNATESRIYLQKLRKLQQHDD